MEKLKSLLIYLTAFLLVLYQIAWFMKKSNIPAYLPFEEIWYLTAQLSALCIMLWYGNILYNRKFYKWLIVIFAVVMFAALLGFLRYTGPRPLLSLAYTAFAGVYLYHYKTKENKMRLDHLKLIWVLVTGITALIIFIRLPYYLLAKDVPRVIFMIVFVDFAINHFRRGTVKVNSPELNNPRANVNPPSGNSTLNFEF